MTYKITPQMWAEIATRVDECTPPDDVDDESIRAMNEMIIHAQGEALAEASHRLVKAHDSATFWKRRFWMAAVLAAAFLGAILDSILWGR